MTTYLLKIGELNLKKENRRSFEQVLKRNLEGMLRAAAVRVACTHGRFYVRCERQKEALIEQSLSQLFGITGWAKARTAAKTPAAVCAACVKEAQEAFAQGKRSFKISARRTDKSFPLNSYGICVEAGNAIKTALPDLLVDVHKPDLLISVEIREQAFIYGNERAGLRGLPVGTAGRGLLLLSGGIDSPVAGYCMASRGMRLEAVYFHAYPYTSEEARQKVIKLASILGRYTRGIELWTVGFTAVQNRIKECSPEPWTTVLLRMAMMDCASRLARQSAAHCLITGESLSQVASQTIENITCTGSLSSLPVFRPLIGMDKESIIRQAERIGTYETSILPYEDCCVLFSPAHPILRAKLTEAHELYSQCALDSLLEKALEESAKTLCVDLSA
ncbi:MAG: tRNA 4-thiouridine(8) synthase ThiI [Spirochaetaceae bacterium]|jgi:thiamine biosynthesis protein ThiI|nr:tRNA 4-thiouridine(8) synthase ThiI [Spirochaetaceae bacterium]